MEPFLEAFFSIDTDHSERITIRELQDYVKRNNIDQSMVKRWQVLFDANDSGVITLDEFCKTLGIRPSEARAYNANMVRASHGPSLPREVDVITATLPFDQQVDIVNEVMRLTRNEPFDENLNVKILPTSVPNIWATLKNERRDNLGHMCLSAVAVCWKSCLVLDSLETYTYI
ncbi:hypothetical protein T265_08511 [Opisthorchis viverrini]|uniref:EF-hand domain-containing protein n=1 Tax=Opisthorchis viverrini TaxID=6198 RepID=A0A074Z9A0_OPIVI|nr:hypothetical protein T265_08511 [Opisthorchis viverrini]KER23658.1 hypothetical protein T265_08511 [Opisthorchis viverrini]